MRKSQSQQQSTSSKNGGEGETRTLAPDFTRPTPLAGEPRHQLEYFSKFNFPNRSRAKAGLRNRRFPLRKVYHRISINASPTFRKIPREGPRGKETRAVFPPTDRLEQGPSHGPNDTPTACRTRSERGSSFRQTSLKRPRPARASSRPPFLRTGWPNKSKKAYCLRCKARAAEKRLRAEGRRNTRRSGRSRKRD